MTSDDERKELVERPLTRKKFVATAVGAAVAATPLLGKAAALART